MSSHRDQLTSAIRSIEVRPTFGFSWLGTPVRTLPSRVRGALSPEALERWFHERLQDHIYEFFYCKGRPVPVVSPSRSRVLDASTADFVEALSAANRGHGSWEAGWRVKRAGTPLEVEREGLTLRATASEYRSVSDTCLEGDPVQLRLRLERRQASPGFYLALGDVPLANGDLNEIVRLYWNSTPLGAIELMRAVTTALNVSRTPFRLKALSSPSAYQRCDSVVLYVRSSDFPEVARACARIHAAVAPQLKQGVPALTKPLAPGLGFAEDPTGGDSFGLSRCGLIADALASASRSGIRTTPGRMEILERTLGARGISMEAPYLNPGSLDVYAFSPAKRRSTTIRRDLAHKALPEAVSAVAERLCSEAIWSGDHCNWVGPVPDHDSVGSEASRWAALGPDIYAGTSGIALFLAESYVLTRDHRARTTALAAVRQAVSRSEALSPRTTPPGFYTGWTGVALAAARIGLILEEESLLDASRSLAQRFMSSAARGRASDLMSGLAGAMPPLLTLSAISGDQGTHRLAVQMGDRLLRDSERTVAGRSWRSPAPESRARIGLSHGASGIAYALLELYAVTRDDRYRLAALDAFRFERLWFDPGRKDWRDARRPRGAEPSFTPTWCHGAPGIALARIRAREISGDDLLLEEALAALDATRRAVEADLSQAMGDPSLCHGLAGNADVLLFGCDLGTGTSSIYRSLAARAAERVIRQLLDRLSEWSGTPGPQGLMLGLAGAGYLGLRVTRPDVTSVLLPRTRAPATCRPAGNSPPTTHLSGG